MQPPKKSARVGQSECRRSCEETRKSGDDAGPVPAPADVSARFPWNGFTTGSVHVPDAEPVVDHPLRPKFMWNEVPDADHYQIQLTRGCTTEGFRDCDFDRPDLDETTAEIIFRPSSSLTVARTIPVGSRYFWRVRACSESDLCSAWTDVRYLDVGRQDHDFNGDGYADVVVGAEEFHGPGHAYVYFGSPTGVETSPDVSLASPDPQMAGRYGGRVAGAGDLNADGFADLLVTASGENTSERDDAGRVYIYLGAIHGPATTPDQTLESPMTEVLFGTYLEALGDTNGDGYRDVAAGSAEGSRAYFGTPTGLAPATAVRLSDRKLFGVGDLNGDGFTDIGGRGVDEIQLFFGALGGLSTTPSQTIVNPREEDNGFGDSLVAADLDGNGFSDLIVGAPREAVETAGGTLFVFQGMVEGVEGFARQVDNPAWAEEAVSPKFEPWR